MPIPTQAATASDEERERLRIFAEARTLKVTDLDAPTIGEAITVRTTLTHAEARALGRLAFEMGTNISCLLRGVARQMLRAQG